MTIDQNSQTKPTMKAGRNWWKIGFFVALFFIELAREVIILQEKTPARPAVTYQLSSIDELTKATGSWKRTDGGEPLVTNVVTIECNQNEGQCLEVSLQIDPLYVFEPDIVRFQAKFIDNTITYTNEFPICAKYSVRIDTEVETVTAVRERILDPKNELCAKIEKRIEMQLVDGQKTIRPLSTIAKGHFVPIIRVILALGTLFQ